MKFSQFMTEAHLPQVNENNIGKVVSYTLFMISQTHLWHLLAKSGQKHTALGELYEKLQEEVDELAERFIANGGVLDNCDENIIATYDDSLVIAKIDEYREMISDAIDSIRDDASMASIQDGLIELQEIIDGSMYKFNLQ